jgi:dTDP-4-amino-4,6-dideoxygalactose transaminase
MIDLFYIRSNVINTNYYSSLLHDSIVFELEKTIAKYVGAKYAVSFNSATSAIFLSLLGKNQIIKIPSIIPPVVINSIVNSGNKYKFIDDINWVGGSYVLHDFGDYKIIDSAQKIKKNQFQEECNDYDLMIYSFYPTKPIGSCDGGMIVSNDIDKINFLKEMSLNGMSYSENNWDRKVKYIGYKMYMNSIQANIALNNFRFYDDKLKRLKEIRDKYNSFFQLSNSSDHLYRMNVSDRKLFIDEMKKYGICIGIHYSAAHICELYANGDICPLSKKEGDTTVSIPFHEKLSDNEVEYIIKKCISFNNKNE